jgi:branched-chain amino acid transport system substrate-binding protein
MLGSRAPITIGVSLSLTGSYAEPAQYQLEAYRLWEQRVNTRGGLLGRRVELVVRNDGSDPALAETLYEALIGQDRVDLVLGPYSSPVTLPAANVAERHGYLMLAAGASASELWTRGNRRFLVGVDSVAENLFRGVLEIARREGYQRVAVVHEETAFGQAAANGAIGTARELGLNLVLAEKYPARVTDVSAIVQQAQQAGAEVLVGCSYLRDALLLTRQAKALDYSPKLMAFSVGAAMPEFGAALGQDADFVLGPSVWEPELDTHGNTGFVRRYRELFSREPDYHSATGFSACQVLEAAVNGTRSLDNRRLRDWIATAELDTVLPGRFKVDPRGMTIGHDILTIQWQGTEKALVWPPKYLTSRYKLPAPAWSERG